MEHADVSWWMNSSTSMDGVLSGILVKGIQAAHLGESTQESLYYPEKRRRWSWLSCQDIIMLDESLPVE